MTVADKGLEGLFQRSRGFTEKTPEAQKLIAEALKMLHTFGIPFIGLTARRLEKMALAFLAVANVNTSRPWKDSRALGDEGENLRSRDIIDYVNKHFDENISKGSYDDIRRKDLLLPVMAGIIVRDKPSSAKNNPSRRYALNPEYIDLIRSFGTDGWEDSAAVFMKTRKSLSEVFKGERRLKEYPVKLPGGKEIAFGPGKHNELQEAIITKFLPRFGQEAEVLYVGDADKKLLHIDEQTLKELNFFELSHGELPDIIAYSRSKNWLFLIEAVHSFGPISNARLALLRSLTEECKADLVYVTAFSNRDSFRKFVPEIAWETEVWIADDPDHLIHFNGEKFLGPHITCSKKDG